ncbi:MULTISPECIES: VIT domain-containing protein [Trichocoleus]|uniref:After-VIT domain-containing protein n=1 Tax=Trichocoleus desertorum GB2-A4 TaxID=2933944 RepID=A0ABV0J3K8_9CYAN|nr:VIT domain-containing protein [Trichocoleus sp. FACHB-46]MBD1861705.1 after-VIT domain-containing protein [Trichocoleus sp. FACHB-46]
MKFAYALPAATLLLVGTIGAIAHFSIAPSARSVPLRPTIVNPTSMDNAAEPTPTPAPGGLFGQKDGQQQAFVLKHTEVKARVAGNISRVEVTQTFENPFKDPLEAIYVFPLPDEAAVDDMEIKIGDRVIKGDIKKREEAQKIYEQARQQGRTAGLLEQERDNIFTQSLANIRPGERIEVTIRYSDSLKFEGGDYEFVFPMVVGPRYIPGNAIGNSGDTDVVPDASRITPPVLKPGTRSGHDIGVTVEIDAGVSVQEVRSPSHKLRVEPAGNTTKVQLVAEDTIPNKDLILRYRVAGKETQATLLTQADAQGGHFAVYLIPAVQYRSNEIVPKDVVFLMDTSGSQEGDPLAKSQELMRRFINGLNPNDTFSIIDFSNTTTQLSPAPLPNTPANRAKAIAYVDQLKANGGSELLNGIQAVMNFPAAESGRLRSVVLLTDGYIGNENQVIAEVQRQLKLGNRLYSFGVGSSVNRFLLDRLAEVGRGTSQVIRQDEPTQQVSERFFRQINNPVLTNVQVTWQGSGAAPEIYPLAAPDLFASQPLVLFGRKSDRASGTLKITGVAAGGERYEKTLQVNFDQGDNNPAIAQLWGRARIKDLMNQMFGGETTSGVAAVTDTALAYRLLSQYTAFVAISDEVRVNPDGTRQRVQVPVEMPEGVSYEGVFGSAQDAAMGSGAAVPMPAMAPSRSLAGRPVGSNNRAATASPPVAKTRVAAEAEAIAPVPNNSRLQVVSITGLDPAQMPALSQYLQSLNLPTGFNGDVVLEFSVQNGRVGRILLDDKTSTLKEAAVVDVIKRSLQGWQPSQGVTGKVRVTLRLR